MIHLSVSFNVKFRGLAFLHMLASLFAVQLVEGGLGPCSLRVQCLLWYAGWVSTVQGCLDSYTLFLGRDSSVMVASQRLVLVWTLRFCQWTLNCLNPKSVHFSYMGNNLLSMCGFVRSGGFCLFGFWQRLVLWDYSCLSQVLLQVCPEGTLG